MEENNIQSETVVSEKNNAPTSVDNAKINSETNVSNPTETKEEVSKVQDVGQSKQDPAEELILGKFKSVEELTKAYEELQKHQGNCSDELGQLRKSVSEFNNFQESVRKFEEKFKQSLDYLQEVAEKYNKPEYFQDQAFRDMFTEAYMSIGNEMDTDKLVSLLDGYVSSRISAYEKKNAAFDETDKIINSMDYSKNPKNSFNPPSKRLNEMTPQEIDEMLDRLI